ncbi:hypothetical protein HDV05_003284 [Chytridiales sp. JEL 0842]|nr:hypothetical protein HDV05_003284 [Chytridiales sp. JEL 0842]
MMSLDATSNNLNLNTSSSATTVQSSAAASPNNNSSAQFSNGYHGNQLPSNFDRRDSIPMSPTDGDEYAAALGGVPWNEYSINDAENTFSVPSMMILDDTVVTDVKSRFAKLLSSNQVSDDNVLAEPHLYGTTSSCSPSFSSFSNPLTPGSDHAASIPWPFNSRRRSLSFSATLYSSHLADKDTSLRDSFLYKQKQKQRQPVTRLNQLPVDILREIILLLDKPAAFASSHRTFHQAFSRDTHTLAKWLVINNHALPSNLAASNSGSIDDLRPVIPIHPLLACLKHPARYKILKQFPDVAEVLFTFVPFTSRYDLQRMYRRALSPDRSLLQVANIVSQRAVTLFGAPVRNTVSVAKVPSTLLPVQPLPPFTNMDPIGAMSLDAHVPPAAEEPFSFPPASPSNADQTLDDSNTTLTPALAATALTTPLQPINSSQHLSPITVTSSPTSVDDRRALLDAAVAGDSATVGTLLDSCALFLDAKVTSDAFSRAYERGDPARLCLLHGWLWPRCQISRWFVLEKLAREEDDMVTTAEASDVWLQEVHEASVQMGRIIAAILEEAIQEERTGFQRELFAFQSHQRLFSSSKVLYPSLWKPKRSFLDRIFDVFVSVGSAMSVNLVLEYRPTLHPRHLTMALETGNRDVLQLLLQYGANPSWPEDPALSKYLKRQPLDSRAALCWRLALQAGVSITSRRWEHIVRAGPASVNAALEICGSHPSAGPRWIDPCRDEMLGYRLGGKEVIKALSDAVDVYYEAEGGDVLFAAAFGNPKALAHCINVGEILTNALREGDKDRATDLLDAGALIGEEALALCSVIADAPPGDWEDWPIAARCYRRILVQQRLRLPIPSREALMALPPTVVTEALLCALHATGPLCDSHSALVYTRYQRKRHPNSAGIRINLVPVLEMDVSFRVVASAMDSLRQLLSVCDDPSYPGEAYCFIKGMLQYGLRDKNLLRDEDEFFLPDDEWDEVATALVEPPL